MIEKIKAWWWRWRYARYMYVRSGVGWAFCMESAHICQSDCLEPGEWREEDPTDMAHEEMSCWSD